jgi:hypothetical protein
MELMRKIKRRKKSESTFNFRAVHLVFNYCMFSSWGREDEKKGMERVLQPQGSLKVFATPSV